LNAAPQPIRNVNGSNHGDGPNHVLRRRDRPTSTNSAREHDLAPIELSAIAPATTQRHDGQRGPRA
jgi:hypothetical protein